MSSDASQLIDDTNTHVQYRAGWIWDQGVAEVHGTRHGAQKAGLQASLSFVGTGIRVIGTLGASDVYGQPTTTYSIDGTAAGTFHAPLTPSGETHYNTTFFSTENLSPGDHTITIENMDGTSPNTFWLDYFLIDSGPPAVTVNPDTSTISTSPTSTISVQQTSTVTTSPGTSTTPAPLAAVQTTTTVTAVPPPSTTSTSDSRVSSILTQYTTSVSAQHVTSTNGSTGVIILTASASISTATVEAVHTSTAEISNTSDLSGSGSPRASRVNTGVIAGAAVAGGVVLAAILAVLFICLRRRRRPEVFQAGIVAPFTSSRDSFVSLAPSAVPSSNTRPASMRYSTTPSTVLSTRAPAPASRSSRRSGATPPYEATPEPCVDSQSESSTSLASATSASPLLVPRRRGAPPPTPSKAPPIPPTALLPGTWHAPSESHGRAYSVLRSLFSQGQRANIPRAADSGLRLYDDVVLP
ncbi:uncharacterized protein TRAVEDRAFT_67687, partial [Trametes versicolor FP-101664 SS1]